MSYTHRFIYAIFMFLKIIIIENFSLKGFSVLNTLFQLFLHCTLKLLNIVILVLIYYLGLKIYYFSAGMLKCYSIITPQISMYVYLLEIVQDYKS